MYWYVSCVILGEGWCLPAAEAMAMALPIIITNYSGPTAYANEENSYLIPLGEGVRTDGFVEPDVDILTSLMKHVRSNPEEAKKKGLNARSTMQSLSPHAVAAVMADRLRELAKMRGWEEEESRS
jgi:glycosyltransferase involved in cell wall biosynthesis